MTKKHCDLCEQPYECEAKRVCSVDRLVRDGIGNLHDSQLSVQISIHSPGGRSLDICPPCFAGLIRQAVEVLARPYEPVEAK
jgi:hypothetical protein